jgi:hypothetical protein
VACGKDAKSEAVRQRESALRIGVQSQRDCVHPKKSQNTCLTPADEGAAFDIVSTLTTTIVYSIALYFLIRGIYKSQRRWISCAYAALGLVVFLVFGVLIIAIVGSVHPMSVAQTNKIIDILALVALFPSGFGANIPPRRV